MSVTERKAKAMDYDIDYDEQNDDDGDYDAEDARDIVRICAGVIIH